MNVSERFLKYVTFDTMSSEESETYPTTAGQIVFARELVAEMKELGLKDAHVDEFGYVYGVLPATEGLEEQEPLGLIAHMDTSPAASGKNVNAKVINYAGGDIVLNDTVSIKVEDFEFLNDFVGDDLIVTDGTTLLGGDDKAGIAIIMTLCDKLISENIPHRQIAVCFTPDEEVGKGADNFNYEKFAAKYAYTLDGGGIGEIEYENFNAANAVVEFHGFGIHPGSAKNKMKNALLIATQFISNLPAAEAPQHTEGYEGFYHAYNISGDEVYVKLAMLIRDHDMDKFKERKAFIERLAEYYNAVYGDGTVVADIRDSYYNMKEMILPHMEIVDSALEAMRKVGVEPKTAPIRGGTDGAHLSYGGLPCPNLPTGGFNAHGVCEFVNIRQMEQMVETVTYLAKPEM